MPYRLLRFGLSRKHPEPRMFTRHDSLKGGYDVVIIGVRGMVWRRRQYRPQHHHHPLELPFYDPKNLRQKAGSAA
jgi:sarcosine oxidase subunit beta